MVIAMAVTLAVVLGYVLLRALLSSNSETKPDDVDYLEEVAQGQGDGVTTVYPASIPDDWQATAVEFTANRPPELSINLLTDDGKYIGVRQSNDSASTLVERHIDENADEDGETSIDSALGDVWESYSDNGGDHGYAAEYQGQTVLVYGSASTDDLHSVVESLTDKPIKR